MIPGLCGVVLVFIGTIITSLGVVRERQSGTLEQLAVMPLRPRDVFLGKIAPYFVVAAVDLAIVLAVGVAVFGVPFRGSLCRIRARRAAVPLRHPGPGGADIQRVGEPGPGHPAVGDGHAAAGAAVRADLPAVLDRDRRALDLLHPAADLLQRDLPGGDAAGRADRPALAALRLPRPARADRVHLASAAVPPLPRARRAPPGRGRAPAAPQPAAVDAGRAGQEAGPAGPETGAGAEKRAGAETGGGPLSRRPLARPTRPARLARPTRPGPGARGAGDDRAITRLRGRLRRRCHPGLVGDRGGVRPVRGQAGARSRHLPRGARPGQRGGGR